MIDNLLKGIGSVKSFLVINETDDDVKLFLCLRKQAIIKFLIHDKSIDIMKPEHLVNLLS